MVGWSAVPSVPMGVGRPAMLLTMSTALAPACWALRILTEKEHVPRERSAILPATEEETAEQAVSRPPTPDPEVTASGAVRSLVTVAKSPAAAPNAVGLPAMVTGVPTKWGTVLAPAVRADWADPG